MKTALIAGSTGLIGQSLLRILLDSTEYEKVIALVRRPLSIEHPKLNEQVIDFDNLSDLKSSNSIDDVFCCIGTTIKTAGSQEAFSKVDLSYVIELAEWAKHYNCKLFSVVSSVGAKPNTSNFYLRTKGQMEDAILQLDIPGVHIFRPSLLLGKRNEFRLAEKIFEKLMFVLNPLMIGDLRKYRAIKASDVAQAMYNKAQTNVSGIRIFKGDTIA